MTSRCHYRRAAVSGLVLLALSATAARGVRAQNLISNGSFEQGAFVNHFGGFMILNPPSTVITNWTVINDEMAWCDTPNAEAVPAADGNRFLDLQGNSLFGAPYGGVTQSIATVIGQPYRLSFYLGSDDGNNRGPVAVNASAGASSQDFTLDVPPSGPHWQEFTMDFNATGTTTAINLIGTVTGGGAYIGVDQVSVTALSAAANADFDNDVDVDGADLLIWQRNAGAMGGGTRASGDANSDGNINAADLAIWRAQFGEPASAAAAIPEPPALRLVLTASFAVVGCFRGRYRRR